MAKPTAEERAELRKRADRIAALVAEFESKMRNLRGRQRSLLERVIKRIDEGKIERIKKSLNDAE